MRIPAATIEIIAFAEVEPGNCITAILPIYQVMRFKYCHTGKDEHRRCNHIISVSDTNDIRIREVGSYKRVCIGAITIVTMIFLRDRAKRDEMRDMIKKNASRFALIDFVV